MLSPTHFIYHADYGAMPPPGENRCAVCGQGFAKTYDTRKDNVPSTKTTFFGSNSTDASMIQLGSRVCEACAYSVWAVRQKNFWATPYEWHEFPKRNEEEKARKKLAIIEFLQNPPDCPFIICVCVVSKVKNMIHKAVVNYNKSFVGVTLCDGNIHHAWLPSDLIASIRESSKPALSLRKTPTSHLINFLRKDVVV